MGEKVRRSFIAVFTLTALLGSLAVAARPANAASGPDVEQQALTAPTPPVTPSGKTTAGYTPLVPARLADTRSGAATVDGKLAGSGVQAPGTALEVSVLGRAGVPTSGVAAVVVNLTAVSPRDGGYLTAYPSDVERPNASNLNYTAGDVVANQAVVRIGASGSFSLFTWAATDLIVDVVGFIDSDSSAGIMSPARLADTRAGGSTTDGRFSRVGRIGDGRTLNVSVLGRAGVPTSGVQAAILTVTAVDPASAGFLTVFPNGHGQPNASSVNFVGGQTVANQVIAGVGADGMVSVFTSADTDLIVDVAGWVPTGTDLHTQNPSRLMDTRAGGVTVDGRSQGTGPVAAQTTVALALAERSAVPADGFGSVILNVTAVDARSGGYLSVFPAGSPMPNASNLNFSAGQTIANQVIARVGTHGEIMIYVSADTDIIVDVAGWLPPGSNQVDPRVVPISDPETPVALLSGGPGTGGARLVPPAGADLRVDDLIAIMTEDGQAYYGQVSSTNVGSVDTVEVPLNKIMPTLSVDVQGDGETGQVDPSISSAPELMTLDVQGMALKTPQKFPRFGKVECVGVGSASIDLNYNVNATAFVFQADWGWTGLKSAKAGYNPSFSFTSAVDIEAGVKCETKMNLASWKLPTIRFAIAGIPIVITQKITADIVIGLEAKGGVEFTAGLRGSAFAGIVYDGSWHLAKEFNLDKQWHAELKASVEMTVGLEVLYTAALYGVLEFSAGLVPEVKATLAPKEPTWLSIEAELAAVAKVGITLDFGLFEYEKEIELAKIVLYGPIVIYERTTADSLDLSNSDVPGYAPEGAPYTATLKADGGNATSTYGWTVTGLPAGLTASTGTGKQITITGRPTVTGTYVVKAAATEGGSSKTGEESFTIEVTPKLKIVTTSLPSGEVGATYDRSLVSANGVGPFTWTAGGLPAGMSLSAPAGSPVALITGTPTTAGTTTVHIQVTDSTGGDPVDAHLSLVVAPAIVITNPTTPDGAVGAPMRIVYTASSGVTPYRWTTSGIPVGTTAVTEGTNNERLVISGKPTNAYPYSLRVIGTDTARGRTAPSAGSGTIADALAIRTTTTTVPLGAAGWQSDDGVLDVTGGVAPYTWVVTGLPTGLTFATTQTARRVRLAGNTPTVGSYTAQVTVTDSVGSPMAAKDVTVVVADSLRISTATLGDGSVGAPYSQTLQIAGGTAPYRWTIARLPDGVTLSGTDNDSTRTMSGTPVTSGAYQMSVYVSDSTGRPARLKTFPFSIAPALTIVNPALPNGSLGRDYTGVLEVSGGRAPYTWTVTGLPAGVTLDTNTTAARRTFVGAPTEGSNSSVTVKVVGADGGTALERTYAVNVSAVLSIDTSAVAPYLRPANYVGRVTAVGGVPPLTFSATGLLNGLYLDSATGVITGNYVSAQTSNVVFKVTAANFESKQQSVAMFAVNTLTANGNAMSGTALVGVPYEGRPTSSGGIDPYTWSATGLPTWASIDPLNGWVTGTPTAGTSTITMKVTSDDGQQATFTKTITVTASQSMTLSTSAVPTTATVGTAYTGTATVTGGNAPVLSVMERPSWLTFNAATKSLSGTPTGTGDYVVTFRLTDIGNTAQTQTVVISVTGPPASPMSFTNAALPAAVLNSAYSGVLDVTGGRSPYTWTVTGLPTGLSLDTSTTAAHRAFTGTPTTAGDYTVVVHVADADGSMLDRSYPVRADNMIVDLSGISPYIYTSGAPYSGQVRVVGGVAPFAYSVTNLPEPFCSTCAGAPYARALKLNAVTGALVGEPEKAETTSTTFTVTDANGASASKTITMYVLNNVELHADDPATGNYDPTTLFRRVAYTATAYAGYVWAISATDPTTWSVQGLPGWATATPEIRGTGPDASMWLKVSGIPSPGDIGVSTLTVKAIDVSGRQSLGTGGNISLEVKANTATDLNVSAVPTFATVGTAFSGTATATGNTPVMTMSAKPAWTTFTATTGTPATSVSGALAGTPTVAGDYVATFKLVDGVKPVQQKSVNIKVSNPLTVPAIGLPTTVAKNQPATFTIASAGGRAPITWNITNLPAGLTATSTTGVVTGTPTAVETKTVSAIATDADGRVSAARTFSLEVVDATPVTVTADNVLTKATVGTAYTGSITATGGITPYAYTATNLPAGLVLNSSTGAITGTPASPGLFSVVFRVTGAFGTTGTVTRSIGVQNTALAVSYVALPAAIDQGVNITPSHVTATGGNPDLNGGYTLSVFTCSVSCLNTNVYEPGLIIDEFGDITGPVSRRTPGTYYVQVVARDSVGRVASSTEQTVVVRPRLTIDTTNVPTSVNERAFYKADLAPTYTVEAGKTYAWSATGLPAGVTLNATTQRLEGQVTTPGTFTTTVTLVETITATGATRSAASAFAINVIDRPDIISISAGLDHSCAVYKENKSYPSASAPNSGRVLCWGHANNGQLGHKFSAGETSTGDLAPVEVTDANGTTLTTMYEVMTTSNTTAGKQFSCANGPGAAAVNGTNQTRYLWCWGYGGDGQLGANDVGSHAQIQQSNAAVPVQFWRNWGGTWTESASSGLINVGARSVCTSSYGRCTGADSSLVVNAGTPDETIVTYKNFHDVSFASGTNEGTSGDDFECYATNTNGVKCTGSNAKGQLGTWYTDPSISDPTYTTVYNSAGDLGNYPNLRSAGSYACYISSSQLPGGVLCWGDNTGRQRGTTSDTSGRPGQVVKADGTNLRNVTHISLGVGGGCARLANGEYWCWGKWGSTATATLGLAVKVGQGPAVWAPVGGGATTENGSSSPIAVHQDHVMFIGADGIVRSWGSNTHKQLNRGNDLTPATDKTGTTDI
jgi:Putative Ig domain/Regulator of chromosome condensation (RCC1) repeat